MLLADPFSPQTRHDRPSKSQISSLCCASSAIIFPHHQQHTEENLAPDQTRQQRNRARREARRLTLRTSSAGAARVLDLDLGLLLD